MFRKYWPLFLIYAFVLVIYFPVFFVYFSQDDFFHFKISLTDGTLKGFIKLFGIYNFRDRGYAFYRPIFREYFYNIYYSLFGLNSIPFRAFVLILHFINITLVFTLFNRLFRNKNLSYITAFLFGIGAANIAPLYFIATGIQVIGVTMFMLSSMLFFWDFIRSKKQKYYALSFLFFILALSSHEFAVSTPFLVAGLLFMKKKSWGEFINKIFKYLWIYFIVVGAFLFIDASVIGFPESEIQYKLIFNLKILIQTYFWYFIWALGVPEILIDFVRPGLSIDPRLMRFWGGYFIIIFPTFFTILILLILAVIKNKDKLRCRKLWFLVFWFLIALLPVSFLPSHRLSYYLVPAIPAFWGGIFYVLHKTKKIFYGVISLLILLNLTSVKLGLRTYWAVNRGKVAKALLEEVRSKYPQLPKGATLYIKNDPSYEVFSKEWGGTSKQAFYALSGGDALQLLYKDSTLRVYYEDIQKPESNMDLFEIVAKYK